jgi:hypothetical protein
MFSIATSTDQAKKLILESPDYTRKAAIVLVISTIVAFTHLILSFVGTETDWSCEIDQLDSKHDIICTRLLKSASCRNLKGPLRAEIILDIQSEAKASAEIICPWENAMSELRICFIVGCFLTNLAGIASLLKESKSLAELTISASYFFGLLLGISALFDYSAINDSTIDNFFLCNWTEDIDLGMGVSREHLNCSYSLYLMTAYFGIANCVGLFVASYTTGVWKKHLVLE